MSRKIKKALFFISPAFTLKDRIDINPLPPLGLGYLGAILETRGIEVKIVDALVEGWHNRTLIDTSTIRVGLSFEQIEIIIRDFSPDIVGVNSLFTRQRKNAHRIYEAVKKIDKDIITITGGAHPTAMPELVMEDKNLDYLVLGEGEQTLVELIQVIEGKADISTIDGIGFRDNGGIRINQKTRFIEDLDSLPFPARHLLSMDKYFGLKASHGERRHNRFSPIITSRGCAARCTFCTAYKVWGRKFRYRSPENVMAELRHIKDKYDIEEIMFEDDNVTLNPARAEKLFDLMIAEDLNIKWDTPNGVAAWTLNEGLIKKMKKSGCYQINFALESGSQYVLDNIIKKPLNIEKVKPLVKYAQDIGLDVGIFLVIGMPGETEAQMWESFRMAEQLGIYNPHISIATPYPGSELYDICKEGKYLKDGFSLDDLYIRSFPITTLDWDEEKLKEILSAGQKYLFKSYIKNNPFSFAKSIAKKFMNDPARILQKGWRYLKGNASL